MPAKKISDSEIAALEARVDALEILIAALEARLDALEVLVGLEASPKTAEPKPTVAE
jgi:hypothetical protein